LDTVLGLSLTSTSVGWVLVEGRDADGTILDHDDFDVPPANGVQAVYTSEQASAAVLDAQAAAAGYDQRLHVVGVTWSEEAAAEAALLLEALTDAGFDNVVPVRFQDACELLARAIAPVVGYDQAAVCVLDGESTIVVMVDYDDGEPQTAIKQLAGGPRHLVQWLTTLFDRSSWQPSGIVIVGAEHELDAVAAPLEAAVPVPVITQPGAELALARGAALASAQSTEFTDAAMLQTVNSWRQDQNASTRGSYAGALTMLGAGAVTFVASLSLALGQHLVPTHAPDPVRPVAHRAAAAPLAEAPAPRPAAVETPAARPKPAPEQAPVVQQHPVVAQAPVEVPAAAPVAPPAAPPPVAPPPPEQPPNPHPLLTKLWLRMHGQDPDQQPPPQPPPPGAPPPGAPPH
jgi:hypothetical protein